MNNSIDRRVALGALLVTLGSHFLLQAIPSSGYSFGIVVPIAAYVIFLGVYGAVSGFQRGARDSVFWSAILALIGVIVLLQALDVIRFSFTTFTGAVIIAAGLSVVVSNLPEPGQEGSFRTGFTWGALAIGVGVLVFLSGLEVIPAHAVSIIQKSAVGGLFLILGLVVLIKGGKQQ